MVYSRLGRRLRALGLPVQRLPALAGAGNGRRRRVGSLHQFAHHQPHRVLSRGAPLSARWPNCCSGTRGRADRALVLGCLHRRGAVLDGDDGGRGVRHAQRRRCAFLHRHRHQRAGQSRSTASTRWSGWTRCRRGGSGFFLRGNGPTRAWRACATSWRADRLPSAQPARRRWAIRGSRSTRLLPQRDDLFRQADTVRHPAEIRAAAAPRRPAVRRAFGELQ